MLSSLAVTFIVAVALAGGHDLTKYDKNIVWTGGPFEWPCPTTKSMFKNSGRYISKNVLATRAVIYKDDAILALPRYEHILRYKFHFVNLFCTYGYIQATK